VDSRDEIGEILARELYVGARLDPSTAPGAPLLAAAMLGESCVRAVPANELPGNAVLQLAGASWVIYVREGLSASRLNHAIAHELGEWFLRCRGYVEADVEELSGRVAAAICVPRAAFVSAHGNYGDDLSGLSKAFRVSESLMALRAAECLGTPTALITRKVVRIRGEPREWPTTRGEWTELVKQVRAHPNGLSIRTLSDSRGRFVIRAGSLKR